MVYEDFKQAVLENIREYLPPEYETAKIKIEKQQKNNGKVLDSLIIFGGDNPIPVVYLQPYYEKHIAGERMENILMDIANTYLANKPEQEIINEGTFKYENAKGKLYVSARNAGMNESMLNDVPHEIVGDIALMYRVKVDVSEELQGSMLVTNAILQWWGISEDELKETAWNNMRNIFTPKVQCMESFIGSLLRETNGDKQSGLWILSNEDVCDGAAYMFNEELLSQIAEQLDGNLWILPSSINEVLILKKDLQITEENLMEIIASVNSGHVQPEEVLSDSLYQFERDTQKVSRVVCGNQDQGMNMTM